MPGKHGVGERVAHKSKSPGNYVGAERRHTTPTATDTSSARIIKPYWNGESRASVMMSNKFTPMNWGRAVRPVQLFHNLGGKNVLRHSAGAHVAVQAQALITVMGDVVDIVGGEQNRPTLVSEFKQDGHQRFLRSYVHAAERLVQQYDVRALREGRARRNTRCLWPPESSATSESRRSHIPTCSSAF